jgi:general secretion pathway protein G
MELAMKKGFTLIEIMVVITILGVLVAMVAGSFIASQKKSRDLKRKSDINQISKAMEFYYQDRGRYPSTNTGSFVGCGPSATPVECVAGSDWTDTTSNTIYMAKIPQDPTNQTYYYDTDVNGTYYQIYARLENTEDQDVHKNGTTPQTYTGTNCGGGNECQYGIASSNTTAVANHELH